MKPKFKLGDIVQLKISSEFTEEVFEITKVTEGIGLTFNTYTIVEIFQDEKSWGIVESRLRYYPHPNISDKLLCHYADYMKLYEMFKDEEYLEEANRIKWKWMNFNREGNK